MWCLKCMRELRGDEERCPDCGEKVDLELIKEAMAEAGKVLDQLDPDIQAELEALAQDSETADEFANAILIGDCANCGSSNLTSCEQDPDINNPCIAHCFDCGKYFCTECRELLEPDEFETHHDHCPAMAELDALDDAMADFLDDGLDDDDEDEGEYPESEDDQTQIWQPEVSPEDTDILDILEAFTGPCRHGYPRDAVQAALEAGERIIPCLLGILRETLTNPAAFKSLPDDRRPLYAMLLLGYFREPRAHELIVDIILDPEGLADDLFGAAVVDDCGDILARTYPGSTEPLWRIIRDWDQGMFNRSVGAQALAILVAEGKLEREPLVSEFRSMLAEAIAGNDQETASMCACAARDLHPDGMADLVKEAYEADLVETSWVPREEVEAALATDIASVQQRLLAQSSQRHPEDFHDWVSWWPCYRKGSGSPGHSSFSEHLGQHAPAKNKKAANKKKAERQARKKARRRRKKK